MRYLIRLRFPRGVRLPIPTNVTETAHAEPVYLNACQARVCAFSYARRKIRTLAMATIEATRSVRWCNRMLAAASVVHRFFVILDRPWMPCRSIGSGETRSRCRVSSPCCMYLIYVYPASNLSFPIVSPRCQGDPPTEGTLGAHMGKMFKVRLAIVAAFNRVSKL